MGGFVSTPVLNDIQTPTVLNFILQEMFRRSDLVDIYSISDPKRCDKYIVTGADALQKLFVKIRVNPVKGADGILYFQSLDGITKGAPKEVRDKQRANCLELSFFFVRIFQIFGAVTLSMFDNTIPISDPVTVSSSNPSKQGVFLKQSNFNSKLLSSGPAKSSSWFGLGGDLKPSDKGFYIMNSPLTILNYYISKPDGGTSSSESMIFPGFSMMYLDQTTLYDITKGPNGEVTGRTLNIKATPKIKYTYVRDTNPYVLTARLNIEGIDEYKVSLTKYERDGTPVSVTTQPEIFRRYAEDRPVSIGQGYPETKNQSLPTVLKAMFENAGLSIFGPVPFSTVKLLRKLKYVVGSPNTDTSISGTNCIIPSSQENMESPVIIFKGSITRGSSESNSKKINVTINATLELEEPVRDVTDGSYSYMVHIKFADSKVKPQEAAEYVRLPSYKTATFTSYSKDGEPKSEKTNMTIPQYIESVFQNIVKKPETDESGGDSARTREGIQKPYDSDDIPDNLRIKKLWNALAKDPPIKSYCIARAVQLLSVDAIRGKMTKASYSSACAISFAYQKDGSIPAPEKKLSDIYALHSLATLFWTDLDTKMPRMQDEDKYKNFLKFMRMNLEKYKSESDTPVPDRMSSISEKTPAVCKNKEGARLEVPNDVVGRLQSVVKSLIDQQKQHINDGMKVIELLFDMNSIVNKKVFAINPEVLRGGMPEVNRIAGVARDILMKYYSGCESTYNNGLKVLYESDQQRPLKAVKADGTPIDKDEEKVDESSKK